MNRFALSLCASAILVACASCSQNNAPASGAGKGSASVESQNGIVGEWTGSDGMLTISMAFDDSGQVAITEAVGEKGNARVTEAVYEFNQKDKTVRITKSGERGEIEGVLTGESKLMLKGPAERGRGFFSRKSK